MSIKANRFFSVSKGTDYYKRAGTAFDGQALAQRPGTGSSTFAQALPRVIVSSGVRLEFHPECTAQFPKRTTPTDTCMPVRPL